MLLIIVINLLFSLSGYALCHSTNGIRINSHDFLARKSGLKKRILVIGQIHGDEPESGSLANFWIKRLEKIKSPSNYWRIIPLANPDGSILKTRMNKNKVDLNRNFPTKDWPQMAIKHWKEQQKSNPRRYPGPYEASEIETKCILNHINDFKPDLIVSIHTPYGVFDFDGPAKKPISTLLPWRRLGTLPGSLGRWAWDERKIPVLTIELKPNSLQQHLREFISLQDKLSDLTL